MIHSALISSLKRNALKQHLTLTSLEINPFRSDEKVKQKTNKTDAVQPAKTLKSMVINPVRSEDSFCAHLQSKEKYKKETFKQFPSARNYSYQPGRMPRLF